MTPEPRQHTITDPPPITDGMTQGAVGISFYYLVGVAIKTVYNVPDSDRSEVLLHTEDGRTFLVSCDPNVYDDEGLRLPPEEVAKRDWQVYIADATDTEAGKAIRNLEPGEWL